jgi:hypothetical protein
MRGQVATASVPIGSLSVGWESERPCMDERVVALVVVLVVAPLPHTSGPRQGPGPRQGLPPIDVTAVMAVRRDIAEASWPKPRGCILSCGCWT